MKKSSLLFLFLFCVGYLAAQKNNQLLVRIDNHEYLVSDFRRVYEKNLNVIQNEDAKDIKSNLELFINYKLKVAEANRLQLDTLPDFIAEFETYRNQLSAPYLQDSTYINKLVRDSYFRLKNEIRAKHILIKVASNAQPSDTLKAYQKISKIREDYMNGTSSFEDLAVQFSDDPSAKGDQTKGIKGNKGDLGYFSAFQMVFPFEEAAYQTRVNEVCLPFRTKYGYHIVKVEDVRESQGEVEIAHILISDKTQSGRQKIEDIYNRLENGEVFRSLVRKYSDDQGSKLRGGKLRKFGRGKMVKPIEEASFALNKEGEFSKPFLTQYGWHIVQLLKKYPVPSFDDIKLQLTRQIKSSSRAQLSQKVIIDRLKKQYKIVESADLSDFLSMVAHDSEQDYTNEFLFSVNDKKINKTEFLTYLKKRRPSPILDLYNDFKNEVILDYYKENLEVSHPEFAQTIQEYREGLLLFELMEQKIWTKASNDKEGIESFYKQNQTRYKKALQEIKGQVVSDYQDFLEKQWIQELRSKSTIQVNQRVLKKLIKYYQNNA